MTTPTLATAMTPAASGAVAILQISGDINLALDAITAHRGWQTGDVRLCRLADIDTGLVVILADDSAQIMPHGGLRIRQRLLSLLEQAGVSIQPELPPSAAAPEAQDEIEAAALAHIPRAASPLAIDLLLRQSQRWAACDDFGPDDEARSQRLNRLLTPPRVVMVGGANIGKSTLLNTLAGRELAIAIDQPGTTRDWVAWPVELGGLVVLWHDTPGRRSTDDAIEQTALQRAEGLIDSADMVIAARDQVQSWPQLDRQPDLRVGLKSDRGLLREADICVSGTTGEGFVELVECVREFLMSAADLACQRPWRFPGCPMPHSDAMMNQSPTQE